MSSITRSSIISLDGDQDAEYGDSAEDAVMETAYGDGAIGTGAKMTDEDGAGEVMEMASGDGALGTGTKTTEDDAGEVKAVPCSRSRSASMLHFTMPVQPPTIEAKAKAGGQMSSPERTIFLDNIYDAFVRVCNTRKPTPTMYNEVLNQMFTKYPRMAHPQPNLPVGSMRDLWKHRVVYKFQNNRKPGRKPGNSEVPEVQEKKVAKKGATKGSPPKTDTNPGGAQGITPQWGMACYLPKRPVSEDDQTIQKHKDFLKKEKNKRQPDYGQVKISMDKTLADRREWLVNTQPRPKIAEVKERYPWLFDEDQINAEMMRLQDSSTTLSSAFMEGLQKYSKALVIKGKGKKKPPQCFTDAVAQISVYRGEKERQAAMSKAAFLSLPGLLQEKVEDIFVSPEAEVHNPVYLQLDQANVLKCSTFSVIADAEVVATSGDFFDAVVMWMSTFYIFNLEYPSCLQKTLAFLQKIIVNILDELPTLRPVITLTNKLNIENTRL